MRHEWTEDAPDAFQEGLRCVTGGPRTLRERFARFGGPEAGPERACSQDGARRCGGPERRPEAKHPKHPKHPSLIRKYMNRYTSLCPWQSHGIFLPRFARGVATTARKLLMRSRTSCDAPRGDRGRS